MHHGAGPVVYGTPARKVGVWLFEVFGRYGRFGTAER